MAGKADIELGMEKAEFLKNVKGVISSLEKPHYPALVKRVAARVGQDKNFVYQVFRGDRNNDEWFLTAREELIEYADELTLWSEQIKQKLHVPLRA
ncbi:MAG: hypothetical protein AAFY76_01865 [Cyanobacteria bacterium J06649_11]